MNSRKFLWAAAVLLTEILFCILWLFHLRGAQEIQFEQEDFLISQERYGRLEEGEAELPHGFYVDNNYGESVVTPDFFAKRGIYQIDVWFQANGPVADISHKCISRVVASDDARDTEGAYLIDTERPDLTENVQHITYRADVREGTKIRIVNCIDVNEDGQYILLDHIMITRMVGLTMKREVTVLLFLFFILDLLLFSYLFHREAWSAWWQKHGLVFGVLCGVVTFACFPLVRKGMFFGDDIWYHLRRIRFLAQGLADGAFPVKIQSWGYGSGYAVGVGYGDIFLVPSAILYLLGFSLHFTYEFYIVLMTVLTAWFSWIAFARIGKSRLAGLTGSIIYTLFGFRLHSVYTGATVGEYGAYTFLPLVLLGMWEIYTAEENRQRHRGMLVFSIAVGLLLGTHVITSFITALLILITALMFLRYTLQKGVLLSLLGTLGMILILTAWFTVPLMHYMLEDVCELGVNSVKIWRYAFDPSELFISTSIPGGAEGGYYYLGYVSLVVLFVSLALVFSGRLEKEMSTVFRRLLLTAVLLILAATSFFPWHFLYQRSPLCRVILDAIQMPFHFLDFAGLALSSLAVLCVRVLSLGSGESGRVDYLKESANVRESRHYAQLFAFLCIAITLLQSGGYLQQVIWEGKTIFDMSDRNLQAPFFAEFSLKGTESVSMPRAVETDEGLIAKQTERRGTSFWMQVENPTKDEKSIRYPLWAFPGYTVKADAQGVKLSATSDRRVQVTVPAGFLGNVRVWFGEPWFWRLAEIISLIGWIVIGVAFLFPNEAKRLLVRLRDAGLLLRSRNTS